MPGKTPGRTNGFRCVAPPWIKGEPLKRTNHCTTWRGPLLDLRQKCSFGATRSTKTGTSSSGSGSTRAQLRNLSFCGTPRSTTSMSNAGVILRRSYASDSTTRSKATGALTRLRRNIQHLAILLAAPVAWYYFTDTRAGIHKLVPPLLRLIYPDGPYGGGSERAHEVANALMKELWTLGAYPRERWQDDRRGQQEVELFGHKLAGPVGISAGLDKTASIPDALFALGASVVEVGGCTPQPQPGNPRPRVFRVPSQQAVVNRYGLNSRGADHMAETLSRRMHAWARTQRGDAVDALFSNSSIPRSLIPGKLLAVQIAKNKLTDDADIEAITRDYVYCVQQLTEFADILVVNVSSPNTPGLRNLQRNEPLTQILRAVVHASQQQSSHAPKIMVKVSPDESSPTQISEICAAVHAAGVHGVIVGNTTRTRPLSSVLPARDAAALAETGGYSGPLTFPHTLSLVRAYRSELDRTKAQGEEEARRKRKVIFASGGITTGAQVKEVLDAGASLAQVYTALTYGGAGTVTRLKREYASAASRT